MDIDMITEISRNAEVLINPHRHKIVNYLKENPGGGNKYDIMKELGITAEEASYSLLELGSVGILDKDYEQAEKLPEEGGIVLTPHYTLKKDELKKMKKKISEYIDSI